MTLREYSAQAAPFLKLDKTMTYRNAVLLIADDWSRLAGCYGSQVILTPRIDEFAARGVVFDNAFCTSPSCAVSRACLLTGQHSHVHGQYGHCHGIHGFRTHSWMSSLPQDLRAAGFTTACVGKKHVEPFSVYPFEFEPEVNPQDATSLALAAREFLRDNSERPFYLHVGFGTPHRYGDDGYGNDLFGTDVTARYAPNEVVVPPFLPDLPKVRNDLAEYYQAVSRFDTGVGLLLDELEASGRADETLVIVTTDHAMPFPGAKSSFFDAGHHCPFILRAGSTPPVGRNAAMMNWLDIRPTIQDWCGVSPAQELPGRSLLPILSTPDPPGWDEVFFAHCFHEVMDYNPYRVLRGRRYKFARHLAAALEAPLPTDLYRSPTWRTVRNEDVTMMGERPCSHVTRRAPEELYDMETDANEVHNLIDDPALQPVAQAMREKLLAFRRATNDPWLEVDFQEGRINNLGFA